MTDFQPLERAANNAWKGLKRGETIDRQILFEIADVIHNSDHLPNSPSAVRVYALTSEPSDSALAKFRECLADEVVDEFLKAAVITSVSAHWQQPDALADLLPRFLTAAAWDLEQTAAIAAISAASTIKSEVSRKMLAVPLLRELEGLQGTESVRAELLFGIASEWTRGREAPLPDDTIVPEFRKRYS